MSVEVAGNRRKVREMEEAKAVATRGQAPLEHQPMTPMALLQQAVMQGGATPETLEKLMGLHERWEAGQARKSFDDAIAAAKAEIPVIFKAHEKTGAGGTYRYEDMAGIAKVVDPILAKHGLSYRFKSESNGVVKVTCVIAHRDGHSEENSLTSAPDTSGSKNSIQAIGSAVTYLQRYTLKLALGLAASKDDDSAIAGDSITDAQWDELSKIITEVGANVGRFCKHFKIEALVDLPAAKFQTAKEMLEAKRKPAA